MNAALHPLALVPLAALHLALLLVRAEEAWEPVLLGGLIPILGALGVFFIIFRAVKDNPEDDEEDEEDDSAT